MNRAELEEQFRMYDTNNDGTISKKELEEHVHVARNGVMADPDLHLKAVFRRFDANRDGLLDRNEVAALFRKAGSRATHQDIERHMARFNGRVDFEAFKTFCRVDHSAQQQQQTYTPY